MKCKGLQGISLAVAVMLSLSAGYAAESNVPEPPMLQASGVVPIPDETGSLLAPQTADPLPAPQGSYDPLEKFNRGMFAFNEKLDAWVLKPVATFYNKIMPKPLNMGVSNFFNNLATVPTVANDILQFHFHQMANDLWRLGINTTIGIGGLFDIAQRMQLQPYSNDFGLTLAYWGYENSNYLVLPFFGPRTVRDGIGLPVDYFVFSVYPYIEPPSLRYQLFGLWVIDTRAQLLQFQSVLEAAAVDKYVFIRNAYLQRRAYQISQNQQLGTPEAVQDSEADLAPQINSDEVVKAVD
ncbi:MAG: hypothetical protein A3E85_06150 [Gammaproteobacteria bacterium RIFCSPHIGHO2_12_FULL_45_12]|nr:MAG: hypothetical protein A3E85_06150 [Gammaproteobacteria bacterium RIFCSPHIGHO2_12_FULL_45_12]